MDDSGDFFEDTNSFFDDFKVGPKSEAKKKEKNKSLMMDRAATKRENRDTAISRVVDLRLRFAENLEKSEEKCKKPSDCLLHAVSFAEMKACRSAEIVNQVWSSEFKDCTILARNGDQIVMLTSFPVSDPKGVLDCYVWIGYDLRQIPLGRLGSGAIYRITIMSQKILEALSEKKIQASAVASRQTLWLWTDSGREDCHGRANLASRLPSEDGRTNLASLKAVDVNLGNYAS